MSGNRWNSLFFVIRFFLVLGLVLSMASIAQAVVTDDPGRKQPDKPFFSGPAEQNIVTFNPQPLIEGRPTISPYRQCVPNALVMLQADSTGAMKQSIGDIEKIGGCALHVFAPNALIGFLPVDVEPTAYQQLGIKSVHRSPVDEQAFADPDETVQIAGALWNQTFIEPAPSSPISEEAKPLVGDHLVPDLSGRPDGPEQAPGYNQISEYMVGKVAVGIIMPESNGAIDPSTENWSSTRMNTVVSEIKAAMNWWSGYNTGGGLSFYYDIHYQVPTSYEPINRPYYDDRLWISETLGVLGYTNGDWWTRGWDYINSIRSSFGTDWGLVIFVVDSLNDSDNTFTNGYFGYTYGSIIVETYENDGWGIANMDSVTAHEVAHNFGAADEYCAPGYACCYGGGQNGYLGLPNSNCEAGCDHNGNGVCDGNDSNPGSNCQDCPTCVEVNCLMRNGGIEYGLDEPSRQQVGIRDSDGDGILDPVDTAPAVTLNVYDPDPSADLTPTWTGSVQDIPWPSPIRASVSINNITWVRFRIDGGAWDACVAGDGSFDETEETFSCTAPALLAGPHTIEVQAANRVGNQSGIAADTLTLTDIVPCPETINGWKGQYWDNLELAGEPKICRDDFDLDFGWAYDSPDPALPPDFSARWTRTFYFDPGSYVFNIEHDDGMRLFIDDINVLDTWGTCCRWEQKLVTFDEAGNHLIRVEFQDTGGAAGIKLYWEPEVILGWRGEYYNNTVLSGWPSMVRDDPEINFLWEDQAPSPLIQPEHFSVRWSRWVVFPEGGDYNFYIYHDDGVRFYIDDPTGPLFFENWCDDCMVNEKLTWNISPGDHFVVMEMWENTGWSGAALRWETKIPADAYEPDDVFGDAKNLLPGVIQEHSITPVTDVDWVKFDLTETSGITLETTGTVYADTRLWLYDSNMVLIEYNDDYFDGYAHIDRPCASEALPPGTYYAKVDEFNNNHEIRSYNLSLATWACMAPFEKASPEDGQTGVSTSPVLSWGGAANSDYYEVCVYPAGGSPCPDEGWTSAGGETSLTWPGLTGSTVYFWQVRAKTDLDTAYANGSPEALWSFSTRTNDVVLAAKPHQTQLYEGQDFDVILEVSAGAQHVDGACAHLDFNPTYLSVKSITPGTVLPNILINNAEPDGQVNYCAGILQNFPVGTFTLAKVTFHAKAAVAQTSLTFQTESPRESYVTYGGFSVLGALEESTLSISNGASVSGLVTLQGRPAAPSERLSVPLNVTLTVPGASKPAYEFKPVYTDNTGHFTIGGITPGTYDLRVKHSHTLQSIKRVTLPTGVTNIDLGALLEGDAKGDNNVNLLDFSVLATTYARCQGMDGYDWHADFDGNTCVNIYDFSWLADNFSKVGDIVVASAASPAGSSGATDPVTIVVEPSLSSVFTNSTFKVIVRVESGSQRVSGVQVSMDFDPARLQVKNVTPLNTELPTILQSVYDNTAGTIDYAFGVIGSATGSILLMEIEFQTLTATNATEILFHLEGIRETAVVYQGVSLLSGHTDGVVKISESKNIYLPTIIR